MCACLDTSRCRFAPPKDKHTHAKTDKTKNSLIKNNKNLHLNILQFNKIFP